MVAATACARGPARRLRCVGLALLLALFVEAVEDAGGGEASGNLSNGSNGTNGTNGTNYTDDTDRSFCPGFAELFHEDSEPDNAVCTTTTTTTTSVTETATNTTTSTTTWLEKRCDKMCQGNGHGWYMKCIWAVCATCSECTNVLVVAPPPPPPPPPKTFTSTTAPSSTTTTTTSTSTSTTTTPEPPPPPPSTTTVTTPVLHYCLRECRYTIHPWSLLCTWSLCWDCDECKPTTTTGTTSSSTSTTATTSTTTSCTGCSTTSSSSSTSTTATTTTTTTTTTVYDCLPPSKLFPIANCTGEVAPGTTCVARTLDHFCIEQNDNLVFECPDLNDVKDLAPTLLSGSYATRCKVCDLTPVEFVDKDPRPRVIEIDANISFGPNSFDGRVNETGILHYEVWLTDSCGHRFGTEAIGKIDRDYSLEQGCCTKAAYQLPFPRLHLQARFGNMSVMIIPFTESAGLLTVGAVAGFFTDWYDPVETAFFGRGGLAAFARTSLAAPAARLASAALLTACGVLVLSTP